MKKLSDYKGEEAIELWADLLDDFVEIVGDVKVQNEFKKKSPPLDKARFIIRTYAKTVERILLRIDPTPVNGLNILTRLTELIIEICNDESLLSFFGFASQKKDATISGLPTENTAGDESQENL